MLVWFLWLFLFSFYTSFSFSYLTDSVPANEMCVQEQSVYEYICSCMCMWTCVYPSVHEYSMIERVLLTFSRVHKGYEWELTGNVPMYAPQKGSWSHFSLLSVRKQILAVQGGKPWTGLSTGAGWLWSRYSLWPNRHSHLVGAIRLHLLLSRRLVMYNLSASHVTPLIGQYIRVLHISTSIIWFVLKVATGFYRLSFFLTIAITYVDDFFFFSNVSNLHTEPNLVANSTNVNQLAAVTFSFVRISPF